MNERSIAIPVRWQMRARPARGSSSSRACDARRMIEDRGHAGVAGSGPGGVRAHRRARADRRLADRDALQAHRKPRAIHHHEHRARPCFPRDEIAWRRRNRRRPSRRSARRECELVLQSRRSGRRCARRETRRLSAKNFGTRNSAEAARARGRVGQPREHEMDDVVGKIVLAVGDEDLLAEDAIAAVRARARRATSRHEVGAACGSVRFIVARPISGPA